MDRKNEGKHGKGGDDGEKKGGDDGLKKERNMDRWRKFGKIDRWTY